MAEGLTAKEHAFVAAYCGEAARGNATKAAEVAGYSAKTAYSAGSRLLKDVEVQAAIQEWRDAVKVSAITDMSYRVARLAELESKLWTVIDERANDRQYEAVAGGNTGLIVHTIKSVGAGASAQIIDEYGVDTPVVKAIQSLYDDVAKELGQRQTNVTLAGEIGIRRYIGVDPEAV